MLRVYAVRSVLSSFRVVSRTAMLVLLAVRGERVMGEGGVGGCSTICGQFGPKEHSNNVSPGPSFLGSEECNFERSGFRFRYSVF